MKRFSVKDLLRLPRAGMERLLVVDDDEPLADATATSLQRAGFSVEVATSGSRAVELANQQHPDLMLLDFQMPDIDALEVLALLKGASDRPPFPVVILTGARLAASDQVIGLDQGAVDYIEKGVDRHVLLARIRNALRHSRRAGRIARCGELLVDLLQGEARLGERRLKLERKSLLVLFELASHPKQVLGREELLKRVWLTEFAGFEHSVDQAIYSIRRALGDKGWIETVTKEGYRLVPRD